MSIRWSILFFCALSLAQAQNGYSRDNPSNQLDYNRYESDDDTLKGDEIPGEAGTDYPIYSTVPRTGFSCNNQQYPGYYADPEAQCQAFYICRKSGRGVAFLCPNGTIFNQELLVCDWWYNSDCDKAEEFYSVNEMINREMEEAQKLKQGYNYNQPSREFNHDRITQQRPSESYGVPGRQNQNGKFNNQRNQGNGYSTPKPVYGPPTGVQYQNGYNGNTFNPQDRTYLPPSRFEQSNPVYRNGLGNGPSVPDRSYLPSNGNGYRNGNTPNPQYGVPGNGFNRSSPNRSYLPPSK